MADRVTIVLHSGDMDKVYSVLIIGNGALAMGMEASIISPSGACSGCKRAVWRRGPSPSGTSWGWASG